jgi:hypothetical protein
MRLTVALPRFAIIEKWSVGATFWANFEPKASRACGKKLHEL